MSTTGDIAIELQKLIEAKHTVHWLHSESILICADYIEKYPEIWKRKVVNDSKFRAVKLAIEMKRNENEKKLNKK